METECLGYFQHLPPGVVERRLLGILGVYHRLVLGFQSGHLCLADPFASYASEGQQKSCPDLELRFVYLLPSICRNDPLRDLAGVPEFPGSAGVCDSKQRKNRQKSRDKFWAEDGIGMDSRSVYAGKCAGRGNCRTAQLQLHPDILNLAEFAAFPSRKNFPDELCPFLYPGIRRVRHCCVPVQEKPESAYHYAMC